MEIYRRMRTKARPNDGRETCVGTMTARIRETPAVNSNAERGAGKEATSSAPFVTVCLVALMVLQFSRFLVVEVDEKRREKKEKGKRKRAQRAGQTQKIRRREKERRERLWPQREDEATALVPTTFSLALSKQWCGAKRHSRSSAPSVAPNRRHDLLVSHVTLRRRVGTRTTAGRRAIVNSAIDRDIFSFDLIYPFISARKFLFVANTSRCYLA